jgi:hypothetical protein
VSDGEDERRLVEFEPERVAPSNGSKTHRRRVLTGVVFGFLLGAVLATSLVSRVQWLNLATIGWWGRPVLASLTAGAMVGFMRRDHFARTLVGGSIAAVLSLWSVYGLVRLGVPVLFIERSIARVVVADLARLFAYAAPSGAAGAALLWWIRDGARAALGRAR